MSNPTFRSGPITFPAAAETDRFRLVKLGENGVQYADAGGGAFGAVTENSAPETELPDGVLVHPRPRNVAVHFGPSTVRLDVDGDAEEIKTGDYLEVGADGKAKKHGSGTPVAVCVRAGAAGQVQALLLTPAAAAE